MRVLPIMMLFVLLSGCVTETTNPKKEVDPVKLEQRLVELGIGYVRQGDYDRAKEHLSKALELNPRSAQVHNTFGVLFQREGEDRLAEEHFVKAIRSDPKLSQARNNYGAFLFEQERFEEAVQQLVVAADDRFYPGRAQVFENLGVSFMRLGNVEGAEESFVRAIELRVDQPRALLELAYIRFDQQNYAEAGRLYQRHEQSAQATARSLLLCTKVSRVFENKDKEASCALVLKNIFPASDEYKEYVNAS